MSAIAPLRNPVFRNFWFATMASNFGGLIQTVGAAWLMTIITDSATMVGLVYAASALPVVFLSLIAGTLADRHSPRVVMLWAQVAMTVASALLAGLTFAGAISPWLLLFFTFVVGCGMALHTPSWQASFSQIVTRAQLPDAVALNSIGFNLTRSVAPAIGGAIIVAAGAVTAFLINALSYLPLIAVIMRWHPKASGAAKPSGSFVSGMIEGVDYAIHEPPVARVLARVLVFGLATICIQALLPIVARDMLKGGAVDLGILLGAYGLGAVATGLINDRLRGWFGAETIVRLGFLGFVASAVLTALSGNLWLTAFACMLGGASWLTSLTLLNSSVQLATLRPYLARTLSIYQVALFTGMALGSVIWGGLAEWFGPAGALLCAVSALLLGILMGFHQRFALTSQQSNATAGRTARDVTGDSPDQ